MPDPNSFKSLFMLDSTITFLNHGSFGAVPGQVFEVQRTWQERMEKQPVEFLGRQIHSFLSQAREEIGQFLGTHADNLVFIPNATHGINIVARSMEFPRGSEILTTNHEYGAMDRTWHFLSELTGWVYQPYQVPLPLDQPGDLVDGLFAQVNEHTRAIFISHISSPTSIIFPVKEICRRARERGIFSIIDGAHAPGQLDLMLDDVQPDFYTGNFHKWLCAPKGSAFLYVRPEIQPIVKPLVVSWGYESLTPGVSTFQDYLEWTGTQDFSAFLSVPAAIEFQRQNRWSDLRRRCHQMASQTWKTWAEITQLPQLYMHDGWFAQMVTLPVPTQYPAEELKRRLLEDYRIEIPVIEWEGNQYIRLSVQAYNTMEEMEALIGALTSLFM
jgi:isopenicillin-N epimerase